MNNRKEVIIFFACCCIFIDLKAQNALYIPPVLNGPVYNLEMLHGSWNFLAGAATPTTGFNASILGPTLVMQTGQRTKINVLNSLGEETTIHWHGLHVSPENDGGPHSIVGPNETYSPTFTVLNQAATYWYHPHKHLNSMRQIAEGLAGMIIVKDPQEALLSLPRAYGIDDFPLILQTKSIDPVTHLIRADRTTSDIFKDSIVCVNATVDAMLNVPRQMVRLRLVNASSQRVFNVGLSSGGNFYQIASDAGMLNSIVVTSRIMLSPGERAEILVDFSGFGLGQTVSLVSYAGELNTGIYGGLNAIIMPNTIPDYTPNPINGITFTMLRFNVVAATVNPVPLTASTISYTLNTLTPIPGASANVYRNKYFGPSLNIGNNPNYLLNPNYYQNRNDDTIRLNDTELWVLHGDPFQYHPFHMHNASFFILNRVDSNNVFSTPAPGEAGLKDVVLIKPKETVQIIMKFTDFTSDLPYVYHCHILYHEDQGMMYNFLVYDEIFIDKNYTGTHTGSFSQPFDNLADALAAAKNGSTITFKSGGDHNPVAAGDIIFQDKRIRIKLLAGEVIVK